MLLAFLTVGTLTCVVSTPLPRLVPAPSFDEPFTPLNGGNFSGQPIRFHPDPLATYVWSTNVNASQLQIYALLPVIALLTPDTAPNAITNVSSLLSDDPNVTVSGTGGIQLDFGINSAAWFEFESNTLTLTDAAHVQLSISEYDEYEVTNLGDKVGAPIMHTRSDGTTMWRLEINHSDGSGLFEGIRFAWLRVNNTPSTPWHITAARIVCQIKPTNYGGSFASVGDDDLSRIWYLGAYTVKVNLLSDQFGSILIYRGDRFSWSGDAHVAQATAMSSLGNFDFVKENLRFTQNKCNGIESYCLYLVLSAADYFTATNDTSLMNELNPAVVSKLEHAQSIWGKEISLGFYGWDDRLGCGFVNSKISTEAQAAYRSLAIRSWRAWASVCAAIGNVSDADHFNSYADIAINATRAPGSPAWYEPLGLYASADAITAGVPTAAEASAMISLNFNDSVTICALSAFNTYFALQALAVAGELDRGLATVHICWDVMLRLGATTTWEISKPAWTDLFSPTNVIAQFQGFTSLAHPWSSGATNWVTQYIAGIRAVSPGFSTFVVAPHIAGTMKGIEAKLPLPDGETITLHAKSAENLTIASICVATPRGPRKGLLNVSELLTTRLTGFAAHTYFTTIFFSAGACVCDENAGSLFARSGEKLVSSTKPILWGSAETASGPIDSVTGARVRVVSFLLREGGCTRVTITVNNDKLEDVTPLINIPNPFPSPVWPSNFVGRDEITSGSFIGVYGNDGYHLMAYDGVDKHVTVLPPWVLSVIQSADQGSNGPWLDPPPANYSVALQDPRDPSGPRKIGQYCTSSEEPTISFDITVTPAPAGMIWQFAFYFADYDSRGRRETVQLMDLETLSDISPAQLVGPDFTQGVWLIWQYSRSIRIRMNLVRGTNTVISAIAFDSLSTTT